MKTLPIILTVLALGTSVAFADAEADFKKMDTDNDGSLSLAEFKAGPEGQKDSAKAEELFKKADADTNGTLSLDEYKPLAAHLEKK